MHLKKLTPNTEIKVVIKLTTNKKSLNLQQALKEVNKFQAIVAESKRALSNCQIQEVPLQKEKLGNI